MNIYERNFWSLYFEFLEAFKELKYRGFSIPYLCHFRSLNTDNMYIRTNLESEEFIKYLTHEVKDKQTFQELFSKYKQSHSNTKVSKTFKKMYNKKGKVVLYNAANLLRFPTDTIEKNFSSEETAFLHDVRPKKERLKKVRMGALPIYYLCDYKADVDEEINKLKEKADRIISNYNHHPMFNDVTFKQQFDKQIEGIVNRIEEAKNFIKDDLVSCFVFSSTHYYQSRTIAMVAAEEGIPTICMQHGIIASELGYMPKIADVDAVYGNFEANWFKKLGISEQAVEVTGHPRFDTINNKISISKQEFEEQLGLNPGKKTILIAVRGHAYVGKWKELIKSISKEGDFNIIVRDFPQSTPHKLTTLHPDVYPSKHFTLYELIHHSDAVVSYTSTVGLEAMIANKPTFILSTPTPTYIGYYDSLGELAQTDPPKLAEVIKKYFNDKNMKEVVKNRRKDFLSHAYPSVKSSGERIVDLIKRLIN
ncbi:hypothetical protein [Metabacillus litoralis]|jgi:hypothetical protein|uniref:hypothetical protein n=1 Tax=Metabacillus litoralis TaxID=152268 RepID=UPI002040FB86|nr:hypothetical protein [Metabacillus litoralis]MCM3654517.1 hypothetical protein [Metabacillus litoralis]